MSSIKTGCIHDLDFRPTSHGAGQKKVLYADNVIKQIAYTSLAPGEIIKGHVHKDLDEFFFVLSGEIDYSIDLETKGKIGSGSFIYIPSEIFHEFANLNGENVLMLTFAVQRSC